MKISPAYTSYIYHFSGLYIIVLLEEFYQNEHCRSSVDWKLDGLNDSPRRTFCKQDLGQDARYR